MRDIDIETLLRVHAEYNDEGMPAQIGIELDMVLVYASERVSRGRKKNLKPFDLQAALAGKAVMLRNGNKAYVRHHEKEMGVPENCKLFGVTSLGCHLTWREDGDFRSTGGESPFDVIGMYPETRVINGFEVPVPETQAPELGEEYLVASTQSTLFFDGYRWDDEDFDHRMLKRGLIFLNKEAAIATAKAMLSIDPHAQEDSQS